MPSNYEIVKAKELSLIPSGAMGSLEINKVLMRRPPGIATKKMSSSENNIHRR